MCLGLVTGRDINDMVPSPELAVSKGHASSQPQLLTPSLPVPEVDTAEKRWLPSTVHI